MPFINGKYYMNPRYGAARERARQSDGGTFDAIAKSIETGSTRPLLEELLRGGAEPSAQPDGPNVAPPNQQYGPRPVSELYADQQHGGAQSPAQKQPQGQAHDGTDGHWVTINHRHVLIQESHGNSRGRHKQPKGQPLPSSGQASIYSDIFENEKTSNGDTFDQEGYTAALLPRSRWHAVPLGTRVELTHDSKSVIVEINDRGAGDRKPYSTRALDLSRAVASALVGHRISGDEDAKKVGLIHLDTIKVVPKDTPLGPVQH